MPDYLFKLFIAVALMPSALLPAQTTEDGQLIPPSLHNASEYGAATAIHGNTIAIGSPDSSSAGSGIGAVHLFYPSGGDYVHNFELSIPGSTAGEFGWALDLEGDRLVVGAPKMHGAASRTGLVHVYKRNLSGWDLEQTLQASDGETGDRFGHAVAIEGDVILIGAPKSDGFGLSSGSAYAFIHNGTSWVENWKFQSGLPAIAAEFGSALDIADGFATIGEPYSSHQGFESGAAYTFKRNGLTWYLYATGYPNDPTVGARFGWSVSSSYDRVVIGAPGGSSSNRSGAAYYFDLGSGHWNQKHKFALDSAYDDQSFGWSVGLCANQAVVSAPKSRLGSGAIYLFSLSNGIWGEPVQCLSSHDGVGSEFGNSVSCEAGWMATGSPFHDEVGMNDAGAAYVFDLLQLDAYPLSPVAGNSVDLSVSGGTVQDWTYLALSLTGLGSYNIPGLGIELDLNAPQQLEYRKQAGLDGSADWSPNVPLAAAGMTVWIQGFQAGRTTNVIELTIQ